MRVRLAEGRSYQLSPSSTPCRVGSTRAVVSRRVAHGLSSGSNRRQQQERQPPLQKPMPARNAPAAVVNRLLRSHSLIRRRCTCALRFVGTRSWRDLRRAGIEYGNNYAVCNWDRDGRAKDGGASPLSIGGNRSRIRRAFRRGNANPRVLGTAAPGREVVHNQRGGHTS